MAAAQGTGLPNVRERARIGADPGLPSFVNFGAQVKRAVRPFKLSALTRKSGLLGWRGLVGEEWGSDKQ